MEIFITVIHIITALFMVLVVLIQGGNSGGVGAAFGSGSGSGSLFGAGGATSLLTKITYGAAGVFMMTSISLTILQGSSGKTGLTQKLEQQATKTKEAAEAPKADAPKASEEPKTAN